MFMRTCSHSSNSPLRISFHLASCSVLEVNPLSWKSSQSSTLSKVIMSCRRSPNAHSLIRDPNASDSEANSASSSPLRKFGFAATPPLDLPAVAGSVFPEASSFKRNLPGLAQSAIGQQDVNATPLEMALVAAGVANGGVIMKPHVLAEIRDNEGQVVRKAEPAPWMTAMRPENAVALRDMMIGVVNGGTATRIALPGIQVAAKTGTAQTTGDNSHAWIIGFAPAEAPRVAIAVIVESQEGLGDTVTGGRVAAPIARAVLQAALAAP